MAIKRIPLLADWWAELSPDGQAEYIAEHPQSKKAQDHKEKQVKEHQDRKAKHGKEGIKPKTDGTEKKAEPSKDAGGKSKSALTHDLSGLDAKDKEFFEKGEDKPGSVERKNLAHHMKAKSSTFVEHLKSQGKEWKHGLVAIKKLAKKEPLTHHEQEAVKALAKDMIVICTTVAVGGGIAHGAIAALRHVGVHTIQDVILKSFAHSIVEKSSYQIAMTKDDKMLKDMFDSIADFMESGDISPDVWSTAVKSLSKKKVEKPDAKEAAK